MEEKGAEVASLKREQVGKGSDENDEEMTSN